MSAISLKARSVGAFLQNLVASTSIAVSLLASVFVGGSPLCLTAGAGFLLFSAIKWQTGFEYGLLLLAGIGALIFGLISTILPTNLPNLEIAKSAFGVFLFLVTLIIAPRALLMSASRRGTILGVMALIIIAAFLLEYFGIFSLKTVGVVNRFMTEASETQVDARPSGLFSEPSWHSLAGAALAYYLVKSNSTYFKLLAVLLCVTCVMSGSSTGLALTVPVLYRLIVGNARGSISKVVLLCAAIITLLAIVMLPTVIDLQSNAQFQKILDPTGSGSGRARFSAPLQYINDTLAQSPIFGMGLSYITERLIGKTGAAVLFFNVFIQLGFAGLFTYLFFITSIIIRYRSKFFDIFCAIFCLFSLGLEGSPFQAILLVLFLCPYQLHHRRLANRGNRLISTLPSTPPQGTLLASKPQ